MLKRVFSTNTELIPWIVIGGTFLCTLGAYTMFAVYNDYLTPTPTTPAVPDTEATMASVQATVIAEVTDQALATPCPSPKGPFYDQGMGRSYVPLWTYWEGRGVTVASRGASYQFSLGAKGGVLVVPLGTGSTFTTLVSFWNSDPNEGLVQIFRLTAQNEDAGQILIYFCPNGVGQYMSDVIYFP